MIPVAAPTGVTATANNAGTAVTVRWVDAANNDTAYWVEVSNDGGATFAAPLVMTRTAAQKIAVNGAVTLAPAVVTIPGSVYVFRVTAINLTGTAVSKSASVSATVDLSAPLALAAPTLVGGRQTATRAPISWAAVAAPVTTPVTTVSYVVQLATNGGAYAAAAQQNGVNANPVIAAGNSYSVQVLTQATRFGLTTQSAPSTPLSVTTLPAASTTPVASAGAVGSRQITLSWTNPSSNITSFTVQRRIGATWTIITPVITTATPSYSFTDTVPAPGNYSYRVLATSSVGSTAYSAASNTVTAP
jgi:hypothetical protein